MISAGADPPRRRIEKLAPTHRLDDFDCGKDNLNRFLKRFALVNQRADATQTFVAIEGEQVVGYYSLAAGGVEFENAPPRVTKGLARHSVPVITLARLAIDQTAQGRGLGAGLLKDAILRSAQAADIAGIRAMIVHAKDEDAARFYRHFDFEPSPSDPFHLFLIMKELRKLVSTV